ncbi:hypothetical protein U9M48_029456 [Paspalum notatum var. saurae]|uniref:Uncharacterized protein n=1 Tax=Paspalum notatum var. saurae TaxID=547442 RepID=A0AAQ3TYW3_PASNO
MRFLDLRMIVVLAKRNTLVLLAMKGTCVQRFYMASPEFGCVPAAAFGPEVTESKQRPSAPWACDGGDRRSGRKQRLSTSRDVSGAGMPPSLRHSQSSGGTIYVAMNLNERGPEP